MFSVSVIYRKQIYKEKRHRLNNTIISRPTIKTAGLMTRTSGLGSLLYFSTSLQSKKVLEKSNEVQVKSTLLENYLSKK